MKIKEYVEEASKEIKYKPMRKSIQEELENHIEELKYDYMDSGMDEIEAEKKAISQMGNPQKIGNQLNKIHRPKLDYKVLILSIVMLIWGFIVSFIRSVTATSIYMEAQSVNKFLVFAVIGLILGTGIYFMRYTKLIKWTKIIYILATALLVFTVISGVNVDGTKLLYLGFVTFSPSVVVIPMYIIAFIGYIKKIDKCRKKRDKKKKIINIFIITILSLISICLLLAIYDITSAIILSIIYLIISLMRILQVYKNKYILSIVMGVFMTSVLIVMGFFIIQKYGELSYNSVEKMYNTDVYDDTQDDIINEANIYGESEESEEIKNNEMLNEKYNDGTNYAFTSILVNYGWIVAAGMGASIVLLCIELILNAQVIKDLYGKLIIIGIASMFILQYIFNILMNLNLGFKVDLGLPLISWGGTSLICNIMSISLVLSIYRRKDILDVQKNMYIDE